MAFYGLLILSVLLCHFVLSMTSIGILGSVGFSCADSNATGCSFVLDSVLILGRGFPIAFSFLLGYS
jgi:hypothetical protein